MTNEYSTCATCGGPIWRSTWLNPDCNWLHHHEEDWLDDPHDAEPKGDES